MFFTHHLPLSPGPTRTNIGSSMNSGDMFQSEDQNPLVPHTIMKRFAEPDEIANLVLFLASDEATYISGANYLIDGGYMCT